MWRKILLIMVFIMIVACTIIIAILYDNLHYSYSNSTGAYDLSIARMIKFLYRIILFLSVCFFGLSIRRIRKNNMKAWKLCNYIIVVFSISLVAMLMGVKLLFPAIDLYPHFDYRLFPWLITFLATVLIHSIWISYVSKKSNAEYSNYYLIPQWMIRVYMLKTNYRKRVAIVFLIIPLFYIVPFPVIGLCIFVLYIIPILLIMALFSGLVKIVTWIIEGRKMDLQTR